MRLERRNRLAVLSVLLIAVVAFLAHYVLVTASADDLLEAAQKGDVGRVRSGLQNGVDPNQQFEGGFTPLMMAVANDRYESAKILLEAGADPNRRNYREQTALDFANFDKMRNLLFKYRARLGRRRV